MQLHPTYVLGNVNFTQKKLILIPQQENKMSKKNEVKKTRNTTHIMKFHFYMFNLILSLNSLLEFKYAKNKIKAI